MKSEITIYCDNKAELQDFARRILGLPREATVVVPQINLEALKDRDSLVVGAEQSTTQQSEALVKKERKPRADAGKPRGPHKNAEAGDTTSSASGNPTGGTAGASAVTTATPAEVPAATPTVAASAPNPAAPAQAPAPASAVGTPAAADPTLDDARAALGRINATAGLGMEGCMTHLAAFSINRISLLKKEDFARFIKEADEKIAALNAGKKSA